MQQKNDESVMEKDVFEVKLQNMEHEIHQLSKELEFAREKLLNQEVEIETANKEKEFYKHKALLTPLYDSARSVEDNALLSHLGSALPSPTGQHQHDEGLSYENLLGE